MSTSSNQTALTMQRLKKLVTVVLCVGFVCLTQSTAAFAVTTASESATAEVSPQVGKTPGSALVTPINLTLSPISLSLETDPGVPVQAAIKIRNNSTSTEQLNISLGTFMADETGEKPRLLDPKTTDAFMQWVSVTPKTFTVGPGEWQTVTITFAPPADAALSYYYTVQVNRAETLTKPGETVIQGAPAVLMLTTVRSPNAKRQLELATFQTGWVWGEYLPQTFKVAVKNSGNVHAMPVGNIFIDGQGKKDLAVLSLNPASNVVLPQSNRTFEVAWSDGFPVRLNNGKVPEDKTGGFSLADAYWQLSKADTLRFGKYTAHLLMVYDNGQRDVPIESFVSFWVIPWKLILAGIAVGIFALMGLRSTIISIWQTITQLFIRKRG